MMKLIQLLSNILTHPLNDGQRLSALGRLFRWQISSRLAPGEICIPFVNGTSLIARRGLTAATGNYYYGLMEQNEMGFLLHYLRPDDLFVDVGANIGSYTVLASGVVGARSIAFEPANPAREILLRNVRLNDFVDKVQVQSVGLSDQQGKAYFTLGRDATNSIIQYVDDSEVTEIEIGKLDETILESSIQILKVDVEGHELSVLKGGHNFLIENRIECIIVEMRDQRNHSSEGDIFVRNYLSEFGYRKIYYDPHLRYIIEGENKGRNAIFILDLDRVYERIKSAGRFSLISGFI